MDTVDFQLFLIYINKWHFYLLFVLKVHFLLQHQYLSYFVITTFLHLIVFVWGFSSFVTINSLIHASMLQIISCHTYDQKEVS